MTKTPEDSFIDWEADAFGCGYGSGEPHVLEALRQFFECCPPKTADSRCYDYQTLEKELTPTVAWLLINRLVRLDVIEYGTSPRFAWLTPHGYALRDFVLSKTVDELVELTSYDEGHCVCMPDACNCGPDGYEAGRVCDNPFWRPRR